mmetsp:Transcript_104891/g.234157  ORF Transcript_104891/g.234157 Transcript_104891/m.234157 type:complete len:348 (-) Transcript_104891:437-1480(-)
MPSGLDLWARHTSVGGGPRSNAEAVHIARGHGLGEFAAGPLLPKGAMKTLGPGHLLLRQPRPLRLLDRAPQELGIPAGGCRLQLPPRLLLRLEGAQGSPRTLDLLLTHARTTHRGKCRAQPVHIRSLSCVQKLPRRAGLGAEKSQALPRRGGLCTAQPHRLSRSESRRQRCGVLASSSQAKLLPRLSPGSCPLLQRQGPLERFSGGKQLGLLAESRRLGRTYGGQERSPVAQLHCLYKLSAHSNTRLHLRKFLGEIGDFLIAQPAPCHVLEGLGKAAQIPGFGKVPKTYKSALSELAPCRPHGLPALRILAQGFRSGALQAGLLRRRNGLTQKAKVLSSGGAAELLR